MYQSIAPVWQLLDRGGNLALRYRPGKHRPDAATFSAHSHFLVLCSQGKAPAEAFPWRPYHPWNYEAWAKQNPVPAPPIDHAKTPGDTRQLLGWLLGDGPVYEPVTASFDKGEPEEVAKVLGRSDAEHLRCRFGDLNGNFYYPTNHPASPLTQNVKPGKKLPTIIWLAPLQCSMG